MTRTGDDEAKQSHDDALENAEAKPSWLVKLEKATGGNIDIKSRAHTRRARKDTVVLSLRCTSSKLPFFVELERVPLCEVLRVRKVTAFGERTGDSSSSEEPDTTLRVSLDRIPNRQDIVCPHCGDGAIVKCGRCAKLSCGGGATEMGYHHTCPWCGNSGIVEHSLTEVDGLEKHLQEHTRELYSPRADGELPRGRS